MHTRMGFTTDRGEQGVYRMETRSNTVFLRLTHPCSYCVARAFECVVTMVNIRHFGSNNGTDRRHADTHAVAVGGGDAALQMRGTEVSWAQ